jgi:predicted dehydrogenase
LRGLLGSLPHDILYAIAWPIEDAPRAGVASDSRDGASLLCGCRLNDRCVVEFLWEWLPDLPEYTETIAIDGPDARLVLEFPQPFLRDGRGLVTLYTSDKQVRREERLREGFGSAFVAEMTSFHESIRAGTDSGVELSGALDDIRFLQRLVARIAHDNGLLVGGEVGVEAGAAQTALRSRP